MVDFMGMLAHKLRFVGAAVLIIVNVFLLSVLLSDAPLVKEYFYTDDLKPIAQNARNVSESIKGTGKFIGSSAQSIAVAVGTAASATASTVGDGAEAILRVPASLPTLITPAADDTLVAIQPVSAHTATAQPEPVQATLVAAPPVLSSATAWPMHGQITTRFGVPHWPFQPRHSGIDISSGNRSGVTPVKPFRAGHVIEVVHSRSGLGNHVIVDHGDGLTSYYCHLYSISVQTGQMVGLDTLVGTEGSTGTSTGTHLHFEIRQNGTLQNPLKYLPNSPGM